MVLAQGLISAKAEIGINLLDWLLSANNKTMISKRGLPTAIARWKAWYQPIEAIRSKERVAFG